MIVGAAIAALRRGLPGVLGPSELALREVIQAFLFAAEKLELVRSLVGVHIGTIARRHARRC